MKKEKAPQEEVKDETGEQATEPQKPAKEEEIQELTTLHERTIAALSYLGFFAIVPFYLKKESKFCRFHGKQGMTFAIIFYFAKLLMVLNFFNDLILILEFAVFLYGGFAALSGRWKKMPLLYDTSCKLEEALVLKTKEEEEEEKKFGPDETQAAEPETETAEK